MDYRIILPTLESQIKFDTIQWNLISFMFTDTHSHIHFTEEFPDVSEVIDRSLLSKVNHQIIVGCTPSDSYQALDFVKKHNVINLWSTLGVHPHSADLMSDDVLRTFQSMVEKERKIVAFGEMGLDYFRNLQPVDLQKSTFRLQLKLAKMMHKAVVVHVRDAWDDALKILNDEGNSLVILHCFTGDMKVAKECLQRGYYLSFSGVVTYPKNGYLREIATVMPLDQMLIETDCPYLTPQVFRGSRNEPAFVVETAKILAQLRGLSLDSFGQATTKNAFKIFQITL